LDVVLLSWLLMKFGGVLNPASVFYLVQIVLAALVLGRAWAWIVAGLSMLCYAALFLGPTEDLRAAQIQHPEIALHMRGMWIAFALTALTIAVLVTRLATAVERRDRTLDMMRERNARAIRVAGLTTVVAGAAHELGTPLGTIAVAARELERIAAALDRFTPSERARIVIGSGSDIAVVWPTAVTAQALGNLIRNALQASRVDQSIRLDASALPNGHVQIAVTDKGTGMRADELARAGEPFFTTKPAGSGMGLGLFVTRAAAEQLGGDLALASTAGAGTTATLTLPMNVFHSSQAAS
jgi:two-component system sensor histidine kinase RegB